MPQPTPLMPHATATWLVDNTSLSFSQIADFCGLHILEVQAMADDLAGSKYTGRDPVHSGELTQEEIERGQADATITAIRERSHWNIQNIQPKDPVTLGLCSQRELDAVVAKAAKKAGIEEEAPVVADSGPDREKLIAELRAERDANEKAASEAAQEAEAAAWLEAKRASEAEGGDEPA